ncbi:MAG: hypothetical protein OYM47_20225 [Gemmatimonadota bacterium]|nr:hypothetical protein [Gemmatimonadota bacterium]
MIEIRDNINEVFLALSPETTRDSPLRLTELEEKLAKEVDAEELAKDVVAELNDRIHGLNSYRIQQLSLSYIGSKYAPG